MKNVKKYLFILLFIIVGFLLGMLFMTKECLKSQEMIYKILEKGIVDPKMTHKIPEKDIVDPDI